MKLSCMLVWEDISVCKVKSIYSPGIFEVSILAEYHLSMMLCHSSGCWLTYFRVLTNSPPISPNSSKVNGSYWCVVKTKQRLIDTRNGCFQLTAKR